MIMLREGTRPTGNPEHSQTSKGSGQRPGTVGDSDATASHLS